MRMPLKLENLLRWIGGATLSVAGILTFFLCPLPAKLSGNALFVGTISGIFVALPDRIFSFVGVGLFVVGGGAVARMARETSGVAEWQPALVTAGAAVLSYFGISLIRHVRVRKRRSI